MAKLTSKHLLKACDLAEKAEKRIEVRGYKRKYRQDRWECGTSCCIHGFAYLLAKGKPLPKTRRDLDTAISEEDYLDIPSRKRNLVISYLMDIDSSPSEVREILNKKARKRAK